MPNLSTAVDDFDDGVLNTALWTQRIGTITESAGALHIPCIVGPSRAGTNAAYTFDQVFAQVSVPAQAGAGLLICEIMVTSPLNITLAELGFQINVTAGVVNMQSRLAGVDLTAVQIVYDPAAHRWLRLRRSGSNVLWETSANGLAWTVRRTAAIPLWLSVNNDIRFFATATRDAGLVNDLLLLNFNTVPQRQLSAAVSFDGAAASVISVRAGRSAGVVAAGGAGGTVSARAVRAAATSAAATGGLLPGLKRTRASAAPASSAGALAAAGKGTRPAAAGSGGSGALGAAGGVSGRAAVGLAGVGGGASAGQGIRPAAAAEPGGGGLAAGAGGVRAATTQLAGETAATAGGGRTAASFTAVQAAQGLSADSERTAPSGADLPGDPSLTASPAAVRAAAVTFPAETHVTTAAYALRAPAAALAAAAADITAYPTFGTITDSPATATGTLTAVPARTAEGAVIASAQGALSATPDRAQTTLSGKPGPGAGHLTALSGSTRNSLLSLTGVDVMAEATSGAVRDTAAAAAATGSLAAGGQSVRSATLLFTASAALVNAGRVPQTGAATVRVRGRLSGSAAPARLSATVNTTLGGESAMALVQPLTLLEGNDETLTLTLHPADGDSLSTVTGLELILKADACDADASGLTLTSEDDGGIVIESQSADEIVATATIPASALVDPYDRFWRLDALTGLLRNTALYGPVTVVDL